MNKFAIQTRESKLQNMAWKQRNTAQNLFPKECKAIIYLVNANAKKKLRFQKTVHEGYAKHGIFLYSPNRSYLTFANDDL